MDRTKDSIKPNSNNNKLRGNNMSANNSKPNTQITYYGKKIFFLDANLAQKIEPKQIPMIFNSDAKTNSKIENLH